MNILQAMDDKTLFGPHFKGDSWEPWRAFLATLFALPLNDEAQAIYKRHTGRTEPPVEPFKEAALVSWAVEAVKAVCWPGRAMVR